MDAEALKQLLGTPLALLFVMVAGALASAFKQMAMARRASGLKISAVATWSTTGPRRSSPLGAWWAAF